MEWSHARERFRFLDHALDGCGGFKPRVTWSETVTVSDEPVPVVTRKLIPQLSGPSHLVRYAREDEAKFGARNAVAVYENHLASACKRFVGFLGRRSPQRNNADAPLVQLMLADANLRGQSLDDFWRAFAKQAKARGSLLLVLDMPDTAPPVNLLDQQQRRRVPYVRMAEPEEVEAFEIDEDSGLFSSITLCAEEKVDGKMQKVERDYDAQGWRVRIGEKVLREGVHSFGACPVLAFTEDGDEFPVIGEYEQVADLSRRIFNARSERDEILRSQTFSLLHLQIPPEQLAQFDTVKNKVAATIGTHSLLIHSGDAPGFIAPDSGPAATYADNIEELQQAIRRITREESTEQSGQAESGVARRLRFEALNAEIATFAKQLQQLELRMWALWHHALGLQNPVTVSWPTDYNLADVLAEIDILTAMQAGGMPPRVLNEKRKAIVAAEFDASDEKTKAELAAAIDEFEQAAPLPADPTNPGA